MAAWYREAAEGRERRREELNAGVRGPAEHAIGPFGPRTSERSTYPEIVHVAYRD